MSLKWGIDAANRVTPDMMKQWQAEFACRYLCPNGQSKQCSPQEVQTLITAGYEMVFVWESDGLPGSGFETGKAAAMQAEAQAIARGFPNAPIYFAFADTGSPNLDLVGKATQGAASVIGLDRTGGYGGFDTIKYLFDRGLIRYGWQTYAWSGGKWDPRAQLRQWKNTASVDYDTAEYADYGQVPRPATYTPGSTSNIGVSLVERVTVTPPNAGENSVHLNNLPGSPGTAIIVRPKSGATMWVGHIYAWASDNVGVGHDPKSDPAYDSRLKPGAPRRFELPGALWADVNYSARPEDDFVIDVVG